MASQSLDLRPVTADAQLRVAVLIAGIWNGNDYLSGVFPRWVADRQAIFEAAWVDGENVGLRRLRPLGAGLVRGTQDRSPVLGRWYWTAAGGIRRRPCAAMGLRHMRMVTPNAPARLAFGSLVFVLEHRLSPWVAGTGMQVACARPVVRADLTVAATVMPYPLIERLYRGIHPESEAATVLDRTWLRRISGMGRPWLSPDGQALAAARCSWAGDRLWTNLLWWEGIGDGPFADRAARRKQRAEPARGCERVAEWSSRSVEDD